MQTQNFKSRFSKIILGAAIAAVSVVTTQAGTFVQQDTTKTAKMNHKKMDKMGKKEDKMGKMGKDKMSKGKMSKKDSVNKK